jgi:hypothetical protein
MVAESEAADQEGGRLLFGNWAAHLRWVAEAGRVYGGRDGCLAVASNCGTGVGYRQLSGSTTVQKTSCCVHV